MPHFTKDLISNNSKPAKDWGYGSKKQVISTNDCFHHLLHLLYIFRDKDFLIQVFKDAGVEDITKSKIKAWQTKSNAEGITGKTAAGYREMPVLS